LLETARTKFLEGNIWNDEEEDETDLNFIEPNKKQVKTKKRLPKRKPKAGAAKQITFCPPTSLEKETTTDETTEINDLHLQPLASVIDSNEDTENLSMSVDNGTWLKNCLL